MVQDEQAFEARQEHLHARQMAFLKQASPDDWHRYAWHHNWDERLDGLYWIVSQPQCDRATATLIFWKGEPTGYDYGLETEEMGDDIYAVAPMLRYIAQRFNSSGYPRAELSYDALADHGCDMPELMEMMRAGRLRDIKDLAERQAGMSDPKLKLHSDLQVMSLPGRKVGGFDDVSDFDARFPQDEDDGVELESVTASVAALVERLNRPATADDSASARIRALRHKVDVTADEADSVATSRGRLSWLRSLLRH